MPVVRFINECRTVEVARGANLLEVAEKEGVGVFRGIWQKFHCGSGLGTPLPYGACGRCKVWARPDQTGGINAPGGIESAHPKIGGIMRLACKVQVLGDMEVTTKPGGEEPAQTTAWAPDPRDEKSAWKERWRKAKAGQGEPEEPEAPVEDA